MLKGFSNLTLSVHFLEKTNDDLAAKKTYMYMSLSLNHGDFHPALAVQGISQNVLKSEGVVN